MPASGVTFRWSRFVDPTSRRALIVPIDHGLTLGPVGGLGSVAEIGGWIGHRAINGVVAHKGLARRLVDAGLLDGKGLMVHLNGATSVGELPDTKHLLTTVETAVGLGADAVSVQVNFRPDNHAHNLGLLGAVVDEAQRFGVPVLAMVYPASPTEDHHAALRLHRHFLRAALELGVSAVKTAPPEDLQDVPVLLEGLGEDLPVLFSGGALNSDEHLMGLAKAVAHSSGGGLCVGRNVFQRPDPGPVLSRVRELLDS